MHKPIIKKHKPKNKFAILVASRNEEAVIGELVESLLEQDYPKDLYEVIVIPNNCTDNTEKVAKKAGATIMKCTVPVKSKGEVLKFAFEKLSKRKDIDAYIVFDADNIVKKDYLTHMNSALCDGYRVAQCFRDSKNASDNWLSGSYSIFYWVQNFFFNKARMQMGGSSSINGTGFMIKKDVIDEFGFNTVTLTEDVEFTAFGAPARKHKVAVGELLHLGLITARNRTCVAASEEVPGLSKVVGIEHPVGGLRTIVGGTCTIEAVVLAKFGVSALVNLSATDEPSLDGTVF